MTAEQEIKREILLDAILDSRIQPHPSGEITSENVDAFYREARKHDISEYANDFRTSGTETKIKSENWSRNYESDEVGARLKNGLWVGWTYWHGGGKHGDPESIDWMDGAYFLDVKEEEKMVIVREFSKKA